MNKEIKIKGGAIVGLLQAKTPLATLCVIQSSMHLNSSILGEYDFAENEIVSLDKVRIPFSSGIKIIHNKTKYPRRMIFFSRESSSDALLENIERIGFTPSGETAQKQTATFAWTIPNILLVILLVSLFLWLVMYL